MSDVLVFERVDGGISVTFLADTDPTILAMVGNGGRMGPADDAISDAHRAFLVKHNGDSNIAAILSRDNLREIDYEIAKSVAIDRIPEAIVRPFYEGKAFGGLTRTQAVNYLEAYYQETQRCVGLPCTACHRTDLDSLPSDRYFRNAWEWSD
jgi:hypothetical protein